MSVQPQAVYLELMQSVRARLDFVMNLAAAAGDPFSRAETAAFHGRKVIEGIAFACLVATDHGLKHVPSDARGKWNAREILQALKKKNLQVFPSPSVIRPATPEERAANGVESTIEGIKERRLSHKELIDIYERLHGWLHEMNPYVSSGRDGFIRARGQQLWADLQSVNRFIEQHFISIQGEAFFCVLRDSVDGHTKVASLSKTSDIGGVQLRA